MKKEIEKEIRRASVKLLSFTQKNVYNYLFKIKRFKYILTSYELSQSDHLNSEEKEFVQTLIQGQNYILSIEEVIQKIYIKNKLPVYIDLWIDRINYEVAIIKMTVSRRFKVVREKISDRINIKVLLPKGKESKFYLRESPLFHKYMGFIKYLFKSKIYKLSKQEYLLFFEDKMLIEDITQEKINKINSILLNWSLIKSKDVIEKSPDRIYKTDKREIYHYLYLQEKNSYKILVLDQNILIGEYSLDLNQEYQIR